jgi:hypothetical protein
LINKWNTSANPHGKTYSTLLNDSLNQILHGEMRSVYDRSLSLDSTYHSAAIKVNTLRNRVSINFLLVKDLQSTIIDRQQAISHGMWKQEEAPFLAFCSTDYDVTIWDVVKDSLGRSVRVIKRFMATTWVTRKINIIVWFFIMIWFWLHVMLFTESRIMNRSLEISLS